MGVFRKSGYDRGHLAAAANHRSSQDSMCATFFLSNMSPQVGELTEIIFDVSQIHLFNNSSSKNRGNEKRDVDLDI